MLHSLRISNVLSFGPHGETLTLGPLTVIVGALGVGKSNWLDGLRLLAAAPHDLWAPMAPDGGIGEWLFKGPDAAETGEVEAVVEYPGGIMPLAHRLTFALTSGGPLVPEERIENVRNLPGHDRRYFFFGYENERPMFNVVAPPAEVAPAGGKKERGLRRESLDRERSVLAQREDAHLYPEITYLADRYRRMRLYTSASFGRATIARQPQDAELPGQWLADDGANLALVLNALKRHTATFEELNAVVRRLVPHIEGIETIVEGGRVQVFARERGLASLVPATRLPDGVMRLLGLLVVLLHPEPPPLVAFDEPELGLSPDAIVELGRLLREASTRTQVVLTTHAPDLVDEFVAEHADSIVIAERAGAAGTHLRRLSASALADWLERF